MSITGKTRELFSVKTISTKNGEAKILSPTLGTNIVVLPEDSDLASLKATVADLGGKLIDLTNGPLFINDVSSNISALLDRSFINRTEADKRLAKATELNISHSVRGTFV